jgi:DNA-binding NarL/FixJ family response regulator
MSTRILIADDSDLFRARIREVLGRHDGWEVCGEAENGEIAIARAMDLQPDVLVLDLVMPDMDGLQVAREIRNNARRPPCILLYTLYTVPALAVEAKMLGVQEVVPKSSIEALIKAIETQSDVRSMQFEPSPSFESASISKRSPRQEAVVS